MCGSMVDIQSAMAEIRQGKKIEQRGNHRMARSATDTRSAAGGWLWPVGQWNFQCKSRLSV